MESELLTKHEEAYNKNGKGDNFFCKGNDKKDEAICVVERGTKMISR